MSSEDRALRRSLFPIGIQPIQLYRNPETLATDLRRCTDLRWQVVNLDASAWGDATAMHDHLAKAFELPGYYGRNLDALVDVMGDVAEGRFGLAPDIPGAVILVTGVERFLSVAPRQAIALVEILAGTSTIAMQFGWPVAVMVQSNDPDIELSTGAMATVPWNAAERKRSRRDR